ncbi:Uncharacterized protein HZ326_10861 [Fusarium oxysporum f. sp. albedinis]|nr:Uncharacterized protein HZ326_10861 [Fusarium oxysporum f. sp. albedinis]
MTINPDQPKRRRKISPGPGSPKNDVKTFQQRASGCIKKQEQCGGTARKRRSGADRRDIYSGRANYSLSNRYGLCNHVSRSIW